MIPFKEAYRVILEAARPMDVERVPLDSAAGRVLAQDVIADMDMPPFDKALVDGYACKREDLGEVLRVVETIAAGAVPEHPLGNGEAAKIMTGAPIPEGADCVFMVEHSDTPEAALVQFTGKTTGDNISPRGSDIKKSDVLQHAGAIVRPQDVAVLAAAGYAGAMVARQPRVGVIGTGDELVEPEVAPGPGQIRNSNSAQLCAQVKLAGAHATYHGIARDSEVSLNAAIERALGQSEVILLSGGVSMGEFDLVPKVLKSHGFEVAVHKIAVKPGKPMLFAYSEREFCFGLPGNPVSGFVTFELFVKPFLLKLMGHDYVPHHVVMPLERAISRNDTQREAWMPVVLTPAGVVSPIDYRGSAHINALCPAHGLISVPAGIRELPEGHPVHVRLI